VVRRRSHGRLQLPAGSEEDIGWPGQQNNAFGWGLRLGINEVDIFRPVQLLKLVFIVAPLLSPPCDLLTLVVTRASPSPSPAD